MKILIFFLLLFTAIYSVSVNAMRQFTKPVNLVSHDIDVSTDLGQAIMSKARRLEDQGEDMTWVAGYSIKYLGCHTIKQWNPDIDDQDDVRIEVRNLVRFRLCPESYCGGGKGCGNDYGDYVVDMNTYMKAYSEASKRAIDYDCKTYLYNKCDCEDGDDRGDDFNKEYCEYDCFIRNKKIASKCVDRNPYEQDEENKKKDMDINRILENGCKEFDSPDYDDDTNEYYGRRLDEEDEEEKYYFGSYCADQGGRVYLGLFTDDSCTNFADRNAGRTTYKALTRGEEMPFSTYSVVGTECLSCVEKKDPYKSDDGNGDEEVEIIEACEIIQQSGKCEKRLNDGPTNPNNAGCEYIEGIKLTLKSGVIDTSATRPNKVVSFFIFLSAVSFVLFGSYVYYLRIKIRMKKFMN